MRKLRRIAKTAWFQVEHDGKALNHILNRGIIRKRNHKLSLNAHHRAVQRCLPVRLLRRPDKEWGFGIDTTPADDFMREASRLNAIRQKLIIGVIDDNFCSGKQRQLFTAFLYGGNEILLMRLTNIRKYPDGGENNRLQTVHLVRLRNTRLKDTQRMLLVCLPDGEGHANLGIIAAGRTHNVKLAMQQLVKKLLHHRFPVASRDADNGDLKTLPVVCRQLLQRLYRIAHKQEAGIWHTVPVRRHLADYKMPHPQAI
ncbi:hypothetical protein Barb7_03137 [Bacteroidales bacterium Barb7]|nr:hypothetical protein Barb7_03137 [Bacteroidales bacterium Barb7]